MQNQDRYLFNDFLQKRRIVCGKASSKWALWANSADLRFSRFLRFATSLALLKLCNLFITLLLIRNGPTVENGP